MNGKVSWKLILTLIILGIPFFVGLLTNDRHEAAIGLLFLGGLYVISIVLFLGVCIIAHFVIVKKKGARGLLIGILILLVLIPLIFFGTCLSEFGGESIRRLFIK